MKKEVQNILKEYLLLNPDELERQKRLIEFLDKYNDNDIRDWNNFDGHIVASGFLYAKEEKKFLVLYHNEFNIYIYPGGHVDKEDKSVLAAAEREITEETGIDTFKLVRINNKELPIDISTRLIGYNKRLNLPEHYHFDFRYFFTVDRITDVKIDPNESGDYKWIDINEISKDQNYGKIAKKLLKYI